MFHRGKFTRNPTMEIIPSAMPTTDGAEEATTNGNAAPETTIPTPADKPWNVEAVAASMEGGAPASGTSSPVPFFHMLTRLKTTKREGWRRFGISQGESIADHMYRMSLITMFAPPSLSSRLNIPRCTKMALIHDMAEALVGDITPVDGVPKAEKNRREATTMDYFVEGLLGRVNGGLTGKEIKEVWQEYEDNETLEAMFVHDVDKMELILQMFEYEKAHKGKLDLGEFSWVATRIVLPEVREWAEAVMREREEYWGGKKHTTFSDERKPRKELLAATDEYYSKNGAKTEARQVSN